jgi:hypothetical protein
MTQYECLNKIAEVKMNLDIFFFESLSKIINNKKIKDKLMVAPDNYYYPKMILSALNAELAKQVKVPRMQNDINKIRRLIRG